MAAYVANPPTKISMQNFLAKIDEYGGPAKECRFAVRIMPTDKNKLLQKGYGNFIQDMIFLCEAAEFPGRGFNTIDARYYGPNIQMPFATKYEQQMNLTFICRVNSQERQMFDDWMEIINPTESFDFSYLEDYVSEVQLFQLSDWTTTASTSQLNQSTWVDVANKPAATGADPSAVYQWSLLRAWPLQVYAQQVTWADQNILRLSVSFSYRYWYRPGKDVTPTRSQLNFTTG